MPKKRTAHSERAADRSQSAPAQPSGRILADLSKQAPNNSYSPLLYYDDKPFVCVDCGKEEIWTAKLQQWWYEVAKGPIYSAAIRCRACRKALRAKRSEQPIRHIGHLMKLVRGEIEPAIMAAGFTFDSRNRPQNPCERVWIDYKRRGQVFSIAFEREPRLVAELLEDDGSCRVVAMAEFDKPRTRADIMATVKAFSTGVVEFMETGRKEATQ